MLETAVNDRFAIAEDFEVGVIPFPSQMPSDVSFAALPEGGFVAVWTGRDGYNDLGVRAQIFDNNGRRVAEEFSVNLATTGVQSSPSVLALPSGGFVITWSDESAGYPAVFDIHGQIFDANGQRVGAEFIANTTTAGFQTEPQLALLADDGFVVAWQNSGDIRAQIFAADGTPIGTEIIASDTKAGDKITPTIAGLGGGGFVIGWFDWAAEVQDSWGNLSPGSRAQLFDASGNKLGGAFALNTFVPGYQQSPMIEALPTGGFVAAYVDNGQGSTTGTSHAGIWLQFFDSDGHKIGSEIKAGALEPAAQNWPSMEVLPGVGVLVVWADGNTTGDSPLGLRGQMFDFTGNEIVAEFELNSNLVSGQVAPDIEYLTSGALVVGWNDRASPSYVDDARARLLFPVQHGSEVRETIVGTPNRDFIMGHGGDDRISGGAENDGLAGGEGNDTIDGGEGDDLLSGDAGVDTLRGGSGHDAFKDTAAGLNGDTLVDFAIGDKIVIADAVLNGFSFSLTGNVLTYTGGSLTFGSNVDALFASAAPGGGVQLSALPDGVVTADVIANQLTTGYWDGDTRHFDVSATGTITVNLTVLSAAEASMARTALAEWADITAIAFEEVSTGGQIVFDNSEDPSGPIAATQIIASDGTIETAYVQISSSWIGEYGTDLNSYGFHSYVHEIGHALGLGHAGDYNFEANYVLDAIFRNDGWPMSAMSYFDQEENTYFSDEGFTRNYVLTPMMADIVAMQSLYGLSVVTRTGDTTYGFNSNAGEVYNASINPSAAYAIFDNGGNDTLDFSATGEAQRINLNEESFSNLLGYVGNLSIARGVTIENAIGGSGVDRMIGNAADNVLTGRLGQDIFTGWGGNDTFRDTKAGLNGDTIVDFGAGDTIVITDALLSDFTFSLNGSTLTYTGGSLILGSHVVGEIIASSVAGGGVALRILQPVVEVLYAPKNDFNGDGFSDVLWRNDAGAVVTFHGQANGSFAGNVNFKLNPGLDWHVVGIGDFNGDGNDDILWRNDVGNVVDLLGQDNGAFVGNVSFNLNPGLDWHIEGTGDFNGDGFDDILWRNDIGKVVTLLGEAAGSFIGNVSFNLNPGLDWHIEGTGDFNGDGFDDILWRNDIGKVVTLLGEAGGSFIGNVNFDLNPGLDWDVIGTGDFNGDGYHDILWRSDSGTITDLLGTSNGAFVGNVANLTANLGLDWQVASIGDFNGDGIDDLMLRNDDGRAIDWLGQPNGGFDDNSGVFSVNPGVEWHVEPSLEALG